MTATEEHNQVLFVGSKRICPQIAYVLEIQDYACVEKLTKQNFDQYRNYQIYVCEFKRKSRKLVEQKLLRETTHNVQFLDDICRTLDEAYYANRKRHENECQDKKKSNSTVRRSFLRRILYGVKHPLRAVRYVSSRIKMASIKSAVKHHKCQNQIRKGNFKLLQKYLQNLKPSELLLYVLYAKPDEKIQCTNLETNIFVQSGSLKGCCGAMVSFGNLLRDGELDEIYHSAYARIVKLSSLNRSYCLCNLFRWCKGYCSNGKVQAQEQYDTVKIPKLISISFDFSCNLCCKSCRTKPYVMDDETKQRANIIVTKLLRSGYLDQTRDLVMAGMGEVFYSPYYRQLWITDLQRQNIKILSNGTLFNEENWRLVADKYTGIDVNISVDAATAETYQKLRHADFNHLMKNLTMLSDLRRQNKIRKFGLNFVVQRDNFREMPAFVELGRSLGVNHINFQRLNNLGSFTAQELLDGCLILGNKYLDYELWCVLQDPIFQDPIVDLKILQRYIDASEQRYRRRYEKEQKQRRSI